MPNVHGKNAKIWVWDTGGTYRDMSGDTNNITLSWSKDNPDTTTFGKDTHTRISGLRDATLTGAAVWNSAETTSVDAVMSAHMSASDNILVMFAPGGSITGCPVYSACMLINQWEVTAPVDGVVAATFGFDISAGSVTAGCAVV